MTEIPPTVISRPGSPHVWGFDSKESITTKPPRPTTANVLRYEVQRLSYDYYSNSVGNSNDNIYIDNDNYDIIIIIMIMIIIIIIIIILKIILKIIIIITWSKLSRQVR